MLAAGNHIQVVFVQLLYKTEIILSGNGIKQAWPTPNTCMGYISSPSRHRQSSLHVHAFNSTVLASPVPRPPSPTALPIFYVVFVIEAKRRYVSSTQSSL